MNHVGFTTSKEGREVTKIIGMKHPYAQELVPGKEPSRMWMLSEKPGKPCCTRRHLSPLFTICDVKGRTDYSITNA
jgi:hypothetical protein|tara:strand:- start:2327 stop:2554 length:228 start_codon:yes stop_codon:yes gene_type:complete